MSARAREHAAMRAVLRARGAAMLLDDATHRLAGALDPLGTDDSGERLQGELQTAVLEALVHVARRHGWRA